MKQVNGWQQSIAVTPLLSLAVTAFSTPSTAASQAISQDIKPSPPEPISFKNESTYQLAQNTANCRRVVTRGSDLLVRSSPSGSIIGSLRNRTIVTIENQTANGWARISSPARGYVSAAFLKLCAEPTPPSNTVIPRDTYRRVAARSGLRVRQGPSIDSPIVGFLANKERVTIINRGANGWVPIASPIKGYVSSAYLEFSP